MDDQGVRRRSLWALAWARSRAWRRALFISVFALGVLGSVSRPASSQSVDEAAREGDAAAEPSGRLTQEQMRLMRAERWRGRPGLPVPVSADGAASAIETSAQAPQPAALPAQAPPEIEDIRFRGDGASQQVVIDLTGSAPFRVQRLAHRRWVVDVRGAVIRDPLVRTLDVTPFGGVASQIHSYPVDGGVRVDLELSSPGRVTARPVGDRIVVDVVRNDPPGPSGQAPQGRSGARAGVLESPDVRAASQVLTRDLDERGQRRPQRYTGRRIQDLDVRDLDIRDFLRFLAEAAGVNIVIDNDVTGTVTLRLRGVPWDEALEVVLRANALGMVREGRVIRVAKQATLDAELQAAIERREKLTVPPALDTRIIPVNYATAAELAPRGQELLTDRGSLSVDARTNVIIATDESRVLNQIEELVRNLDTQTPQVLIEARIVEASSTYTRQLGIQWGGDFLASSATGNPTGLVFPSSIGMAGGATDTQAPLTGLTSVRGGQANPNFAVNLPAAVGTGTGGALALTLGSVANNVNLALRISAAEDSGTLRIISSPRILTLDNREAHIEQGTMIPYSQVSAQGVQTAFQEAKLNLTVTPHVTSDGGVLMKIMVTRNEPDFAQTGARGDPTILKREAETELLVMDGHTAVIGGIYTRNTGLNYSQVPLLGDIPFLGWLFKARRDTDRRSELLIFITPRIVNRAESIGR